MSWFSCAGVISIGDLKKDYGLHSLRAGGASAAANEQLLMFIYVTVK